MTNLPPPRKKFSCETIYDIRITIETWRGVNLPLLRSTARTLRRRERRRLGLPQEPRPIETLAIEELLERDVCVLAHGETESVARMACDMLRRAHVKPSMDIQLLPGYATPPDETRMDVIYPDYRPPKHF